MPKSQNSLSADVRNLTFLALPQANLEKLAPHLTRVDIPQGTILVESDQPIQWVHFLERGMASVNSLDANGTSIEVGIIGREGIVGMQALLGQTRTQNTIVMQGAGEGYRISAKALQEQTSSMGEFLKPVHTFVYAMLEQTTQLILCNRLHEVEARLARWLLMASDCMESPMLHLTQEYLSQMLGVGRPAVTIAAGVLQRDGLIAYSRGQVKILQREHLQAAACECYGIIREAYQRVYPSLYQPASAPVLQP